MVECLGDGQGHGGAVPGLWVRVGIHDGTVVGWEGLWELEGVRSGGLPQHQE